MPLYECKDALVAVPLLCESFDKTNSMYDARQAVGRHTKRASSTSRTHCMISKFSPSHTECCRYYVPMINKPENVSEASENRNVQNFAKEGGVERERERDKRAEAV